MTVTVSRFDVSVAWPDLLFLASGERDAGMSCAAGADAPAFSAGVPVGSDARAAFAAAASNATDTAIDTGCLRCTFDTGVTLGLISFFLDALRCAFRLFRKCHSRQRPLAIAWIASGENAQITSFVLLGRGNACVQLPLPVPLHDRRQRQSGEQRPRAEIGMDLKFTDGAGLGAYDGSLGLVAEAPCQSLDSQGDVLDVSQRRTAPQPAHVADVRHVNWSGALRRLPAGQAHSRLV